MHKYEELEKLYYKRKYTKYFIVSMIVIFSIVCLFFIKSYDQNEKKIIKNDKVKTIQKTDNSEKKVKQTIKATKKIEDNITQKIVKKEIKSENRVKKLVLYPIFPDIDTNNTAEEIKPKIKSQSKIQVEEKSIQKDDTKHSLKIVVKSVKTTTDLIHVFEKSPTYENAIKISKIYFERKNYQKAVEWAKKANKIDPEDYESWYVFAKSLIKLEEKDKAKKVLIAYLKTYGPDKNIEELLRSIK